jgi:hypothetical protein
MYNWMNSAIPWDMFMVHMQGLYQVFVDELFKVASCCYLGVCATSCGDESFSDLSPH